MVNPVNDLFTIMNKPIHKPQHRSNCVGKPRFTDLLFSFYVARFHIIAASC